jgi:hypothetical protein
MVRKIFPRYVIPLLVLSSLYFSPGSATDTLFPSTGNNPIMDGEKAPHFYLEDIKGYFNSQPPP